MRVLVTGNMGYVGPVLARFLKANRPDVRIVGYDSGYFAESVTSCESKPELLLEKQHYGDVRDFPKELLEGVDAVVHLAAISNDPMGNKFEKVTKEINEDASVRIAEMAAEAGVKNFVFASSCSMYGFADGGPRRETDPTNPLTAYARSKIGTEGRLRALDLKGMVVTCLRFATACGASDRTRLDLVLNDFVACALTSGEITVLSDGSPWRPLIDVEDMARAITWAISRSKTDGGDFLAVNAGANESNYQVKDIAQAVARRIPNVKININENAPADNRSYKVNFDLFKEISGEFYPKVDLDTSIDRLVSCLRFLKPEDRDFRSSDLVRLKCLEKQIQTGKIDDELRWRRAG